MESLVIYDSRFGNTRKVAEAVAEGLEDVGTVRVLGIDGICPRTWGAPTCSSSVARPRAIGYRSRCDDSSIPSSPGRKQDLVAGVFDTRYRAPGVFTGSAARLIATRLRKAGITLLLPLRVSS